MVYIYIPQQLVNRERERDGVPSLTTRARSCDDTTSISGSSGINTTAIDEWSA